LHAPSTHVWFVHGTAAPNCPLAPHVSTPLSEHCVAPGVHEPVQMPALHTPGQAAPLFCHAPVVSHVCGCCPEHCSHPGTQTPEQTPPLHA
jgi:hypothetical protein